MVESFFERPILNSPYAYPARHWELDADGQPTNHIADRRRRSELVTPVPKPQKRRRASGQGELVLGAGDGLSTTEQEYNPTPIINEIRGYVAAWRKLPNPSQWQVTPETARLLQHWRHHRFENLRPFFCQIEAVETAIWLAEVASERGAAGARIWTHLRGANKEANPELLRIALKLATGAGKTTVMAMLIAWQTVNAVRHPGSKNFSRAFLIITPGITIKDRLRVLQPNDPNSYYRERELVPPDMLGDIDRAKIVITNYHAFRRREETEVSKAGRALLQGRGPELNTIETEGRMLQRACGDLMGLKNIVVLNDEAHHCYREKPQAADGERLKGEDKEEARKNNEAARLWISGIETVKKKLGLAAVYDLSATPFFLRGSGYVEGTLFPWTVSDFSLMDAIECGIVKLPRVPVADNIPGGDMPRFRELWKHVGPKMPKKGRGKSGELDPLSLPVELQTALEALYGHYAETFALWEKEGIDVPPVFIVVCNNTSTSKLAYDFISGFKRKGEDEAETYVGGRFELFRNYDDYGNRLARPRTLLIDSEQLELGEALDKEFRTMAVDEIERFRRDLVQRTGNAQAGEKISDQDLLREVMNTVGKKDRLGESIRCVVSVSMLAEGWDANTVTHILGVRAFGTQLLCEQVIGRALRRLSYRANEDGLLSPEYADVLGIPFDFTAKPVVVKPTAPRKTVRVEAVRPDRDALEIRFPRVEGYRVDLPEERLTAKFTADSILELTPEPRRPDRYDKPGDHRQADQSDGQASGRYAPVGDHLSAHCPAAVPAIPRCRRRAQALPFQPVEAHRPGMARRLLPALHRRHLPGAIDLSGHRRSGVRADQGGNHRVDGRRAPDQGGARSVQPGGLDRACPVRHVEDDAVADRPPALPCQLRRLRQRLGGRVLPRRRGQPARPRLRQEPGARLRGTVSARRRRRRSTCPTSSCGSMTGMATTIS